ncbi:MAG: hypothetical protein ACT4P7_15500 [Gemmatimonadaceae bacterium]
MPLPLSSQHPSLVIRKAAFERVGLTRAAIDERLHLTDEEFTMEGSLIVIGPIHEEAALQEVIAELEHAGLVYFEEFFDFSGNWPQWLALFAMARG